ncbi:hypothetical protein EUW85_19290 [Salmonella enterica subsp. enterica serovar Ngili]|nr:hypothetical protein [Salmonella enterica subsp. enterica serovar Ngili]
MTTTTASSAAIPSDTDLPLSAHLTEPAGPAPGSPEAPVTPETSAQSAAHRPRPGGRVIRLWRPASASRSLILKAASVLVFFVLTGAVIFLWLTVRQQQIQLTTLDAAFRSGQLQALTDRMQDIERRQQQYVLSSQADKWQQSLSEQSQSLTAFGQQLSTLALDVETTQAAVTKVMAGQDESDVRFDALEKSLDAQKVRIDTLESWKEAWSQRTATPIRQPNTAPASGGSPVAAKKPSVPRPLKPPFTLMSTERRGGQAYAVILPVGAGGWAQLRMLSPGESYSGWTLVNINGNQAEFQVNGQIKRLTF